MNKLSRPRYQRLCWLEDEIVVALVCTPDEQPLDTAMLTALERVQTLRQALEAQLENRR